METTWLTLCNWNQPLNINTQLLHSGPCRIRLPPPPSPLLLTPPSSAASRTTHRPPCSSNPNQQHHSSREKNTITNPPRNRPRVAQSIPALRPIVSRCRFGRRRQHQQTPFRLRVRERSPQPPTTQPAQIQPTLPQAPANGAIDVASSSPQATTSISTSPSAVPAAPPHPPIRPHLHPASANSPQCPQSPPPTATSPQPRPARTAASPTTPQPSEPSKPSSLAAPSSITPHHRTTTQSSNAQPPCVPASSLTPDPSPDPSRLRPPGFGHQASATRLRPPGFVPPGFGHQASCHQASATTGSGHHARLRPPRPASATNLAPDE